MSSASTPRWFGPALALTAGAGAAWRAVYVLTFVRDHVPLVGDALTYHLLAGLLAGGEGYVRPLDHIVLGREIPTAEFPPLWPLVLALADLAGLDGPTAQRLVGAALGACTVVLVGLLAKVIAGPRAGIAAAVLAAGSPQLVTLDGALLAEALYVPLVAATLLATAMILERSDQPPTRPLLVTLGSLVALAAITRAEGIVLAAALVVPVVMIASRRPSGLPIAPLALALTPVVLVMGCGRCAMPCGWRRSCRSRTTAPHCSPGPIATASTAAETSDCGASTAQSPRCPLHRWTRRRSRRLCAGWASSTCASTRLASQLSPPRACCARSAVGRPRPAALRASRAGHTAGCGRDGRATSLSPCSPSPVSSRSGRVASRSGSCSCRSASSP
jgi:hypothetical protein